jgi:eukaryotic-like serine/threonine-protein kinase
VNNRMGEYESGELIGSGEYGDVYEGLRTGDNWQCAIKMLRESVGPEILMRFRREVRIQEKLNHENIVPIIEYNLDDDRPWFVMPKAKYNLRRYLQDFHGEDELWIINQIAAGLEYAHANNVIHRDIKPDNILFFEDEHGSRYIAISDFGLGRFINRDTATLTFTNIGLGTIAYMAPEQFTQANEADIRADVYAFGKIIYEVLTGDISPSLDINYYNAPRKFLYIIMKCREKDQMKRYQTIKDLIRDLDLATENDDLFIKPTEAVRREIKTSMEELEYTLERVEKITQIIINNINDIKFLLEILPELSPGLLKLIADSNKDIFINIIQSYDNALCGTISFDYCDIVADFYEKIFDKLNLDDVRTMILRRLAELGPRRNRYYVGRVFARIVNKITDQTLIFEIVNIFESDKSKITWHKVYLNEYILPTAIKSIIK